MGTLTLPAASLIYIDTPIVIYSVEKHSDYWELLKPLWLKSQANEIQISTSELTLMEVLVAPLRNADTVLVAAYEALLLSTEIQLLPITQSVLKDAAQLRADNNLRTPDAIHAAAALTTGCNLFLTNDQGFRRVPGLPLIVLSEIVLS